MFQNFAKVHPYFTDKNSIFSQLNPVNTLIIYLPKTQKYLHFFCDLLSQADSINQKRIYTNMQSTSASWNQTPSSTRSKLWFILHFHLPLYCSHILLSTFNHHVPLTARSTVLKQYKITGNYLLRLETQLSLLWKSELNSNIIQHHDQLTLVHWTKLVLTGKM
jgi:hypothetical protein